MATLTIKLKQHTPYIHFQHNHLGATLRASDLKPRIDKYLGGTQKYQLAISAEMENDYPKDKEQGKEPYFGDYKLCRYENIVLTFNTYFDTDLKNKIEEVLLKVFAHENFGSFGSKGYGCFTIDGRSQTDFENLLKAKFKTVYYWETNETSDDKIFFQIKYFYALLKSGINIPRGPDRTYHKSLLMQYFLKDDIRWEKRGIKKKFGLMKSRDARFLDCGEDEIGDKEKYKAVKPLLGYSTSQKWQSYGKEIDIKFPDNIDRINSPLFFKVYKNKQNNFARIYFMLRNDAELKNKILPNKPFNYTIDTTTKPFHTPDNFDYPTFLQYAVDEINKITVTNNGRVNKFIESLKNNIKPL